MKKDTALEFLFFSYFRIDFQDANNKNKLIEAAIERAYIDASNHVLQLKKDNVLNEKQILMIRKKCKKDGEHAIKKALEIQATVEDVYEIIKKIYNSSGLTMTLGITQKWYNMTIKYLFVMNAILNDVGNTVLEELCHKFAGRIDVPVDDNIIRVACDMSVEVPCRNKDNTYSGMKEIYSNKIPWSQWDQISYYHAFQKNIKDKLDNENILDEENRIWISVAKKDK